MSRWTRWLPMKPAPPVMHTRFPVRAMSFAVSRVSFLVLVLPEREQLVLGDPELDQARELRAGSLQRRDDDQVVRDLLVLGDRMHPDAEELVAVALIEDRHRLEPRFAQRQIRELGGF